MNLAVCYVISWSMRQFQRSCSCLIAFWDHMCVPAYLQIFSLHLLWFFIILPFSLLIFSGLCAVFLWIKQHSLCTSHNSLQDFISWWLHGSSLSCSHGRVWGAEEEVRRHHWKKKWICRGPIILFLIISYAG